MTYSPKLTNSYSSISSLVEAVRDGVESPIPALVWLFDKTQSQQEYRTEAIEAIEAIVGVAIGDGDKQEISFLYRGKLIILSRDGGEIMYQVSLSD